jgi:hypothetical protein
VWGAASARPSEVLRDRRRRRWGYTLREQIEGARGGAHPAGRDARVVSRRRQAPVREQELDGADVAAGLEQMDGEGVAANVR